MIKTLALDEFELYAIISIVTLTAAAVRPADEHPMPVVWTALGATDTALNRSLDLAKPGSPNKSENVFEKISRGLGSGHIEFLR